MQSKEDTMTKDPSSQSASRRLLRLATLMAVAIAASLWQPAPAAATDARTAMKLCDKRAEKSNDCTYSVDGEGATTICVGKGGFGGGNCTTIVCGGTKSTDNQCTCICAGKSSNNSNSVRSVLLDQVRRTSGALEDSKSTAGSPAAGGGVSSAAKVNKFNNWGDLPASSILRSSPGLLGSGGGASGGSTSAGRKRTN
jgi:hypothetical protein